LSAFTWPPDNPEAAALAAAAGAGREPVAAAVLVPLYMSAPAPASEPEPHLVLTRRRSDLRRHAGEISFPGGRMDGEDMTLEETALREAEEEIGLARQRVSVIGELPPTSTFATNYVIHPFVATIPERMAWRLSAKEVEAVLELPLSRVRAGRTQTQLQRRGITFTTDAFVVDDEIIWGATARIIENLLGRLRREEPGGAIALEPA
jgi:8-oxo-dGTP pyrophosphatase MutT (NUDIX family)